jgi:hypothetical protein
MMTDLPARVTSAEVSDLIGQARAAPSGASLADRIAYQERKAQLRTGMAAYLDAPDAHNIAAEAWHELARLAVDLRASVEDAS